MEFCIDRSLLGTPHHLVNKVGGAFSWVNDIPNTAWHLNGSCKAPPSLCLDTAARLLGIAVPSLPPNRFLRALRSIAPSLQHDHVPWSHVMPKRDHAAFVEMLVKSANEAMDGVTLDYLALTWMAGAGAFDGLSRVRIDKRLFAERIATESSNDSVVSTLTSFKPADDGFADPISYDRLSTSTGRLTVSNGPQILTLRKDLRQIMVSRRGVNGAIVALDFSSLEARIVLRTVGGIDPGVPDLYGAIASELGGRAGRKAIKTCVLSLLFGAGRRSIADRLGTNGPEVDDLIELVSQRFGFAALGSALARMRSDSGLLRNAFGRPLLIEGHESPPEALLVSHFAQSTGVDVALVGFNTIRKQLAVIAPRVKSLFVLHDALFLDVPLQDLPAVESMDAVSIHGFDTPFPLRTEIIRCDA